MVALHPRHSRASTPLAVAAALLVSVRAQAQVVNPADAQRDRSTPPGQEVEGTGQVDATPRWQRLRTWELPDETIVRGAQPTGYTEDELVGTYGQPRWTTKRLFPTTRVYVVPEGKVEFEHWTRVKTPREGPTTVENQYELEFGLPHRFQLDLYFVTDKTGSDGELDVIEHKYEVRYALADWGEIAANPTLYFEWVERSSEADKIEAKLLLGDDLAPGWHWGANLVYEHEVSGALESEYSLTAGVSRVIVDDKFSLGAELKSALIDEHGNRGHFSEELEIGPSMRWKPLPALHIDLAPLVGIGPESRQSDVYLVIGWEF